MTDQEVYQYHLVSRVERSQQQAQLTLVTLWSQLEPESQIQLAQRLAELIQRMRKAAYLEKNSHDGI